MSAVNETIVREYLELHGFLVRQERKFMARGREVDDGIDFFAWNPQADKQGLPVPFVLSSEDLPAVERAIVVVRGWHTETFSPGMLDNSPEIFRFLEPKVFEQAARSFGLECPLLKILILPSLPQTEDLREQSIRFLRDKGIDAVIPFRTLLADLVARTEVHRNYDKSDFLQTVRVLKNYGFIKEPQMELFQAPRLRKKVVKTTQPGELF